jgi:tetratricopeptide (TPR) repeat protein
MRVKALRLYQQAGYHCGIARASDVLAGTALRQGHIKEGKKYIELTTDEMKVAPELNATDLASIFSTQALFASLSGNPSAAISGYEHALQILKGMYKADSPVLAWEYLSLGLAYADANRFEDALREMRQGLSILDRMWGRNVPRYLEAEIAYSQVLNRSGDHKAAASLRTADETALKDLKRTQCALCTISADAFR